MDRESFLKIALAAVVASVIAWVYASGAYEQFDPATMRVWFQDAGAWGGLLFIAAYSCLQPFGLNGLVFLLSAPLIWSPTEAFLLNWGGTVGTALFSFSGARFVARDWIQQRLPQRVRRFDDRLRTHGFRTVLLLRLIFYTTPTVQWALGVSRVSFVPFLAGTVLGVAPFTLMTTLVGVRVAAWIAEHPVATWPWEQLWPVLIIAAVVIAAIGVFALRID
ncbi:MAG: TVP38/TMEM64 family protein [Deltaproteobacteria bacterium]|nr:TVP38/TMEM64 family protein [Deltaproteobacteria bacterium]